MQSKKDVFSHGERKCETANEINCDAARRLMEEIKKANMFADASVHDQAKPISHDEFYRKMGELAYKTHTLCSKSNNIGNQVIHVLEMDNDEFQPDKAILLARTLVKAKMECILTLGALNDFRQSSNAEDPELAHMTRLTKAVIAQYGIMSSDLEAKLLIVCGLTDADLALPPCAANGDNEQEDADEKVPAETDVEEETGKN